MMDFYNQKHAKARKSHKCEFCGKEIVTGETYSYESGKFDGDFYRLTYMTCSKIIDGASTEQLVVIEQAACSAFSAHISKRAKAGLNE